jgi:hypothetical protein
MRLLRLAAPLWVVVVVMSGCSGSSPDAAGSPTPSVAPVTVTRDVRFATAAPDLTAWSDPLLDVYAPTGAHGLPLVVFFPAHSLTKNDSEAYPQLATAVAEKGAVVVVANWSQAEEPPGASTDAKTFAELIGLGQSVAGCAVSFAVARAGDYGADPTRVVLAGELMGANIASMVALGTPESYPDCEASTGWTATGLVGVNDDWLALYPGFDQVAAAAVEGMSPWALLTDAPEIPTAAVVTDAGVTVSARCDDRDAEWMVSRDPSGDMRTRLDEVGAYSDGCVDLADAAGAMAKEMTAQGLTAKVVQLTNPDGATQSGGGADIQLLGPADLTALSDTVIGLSQ